MQELSSPIAGKDRVLLRNARVHDGDRRKIGVCDRWNRDAACDRGRLGAHRSQGRP